MQAVDIFVDARWPEGTGIGRMYRSYVNRAPIEARVVELEIASKIGSPFSTLAVSRSLQAQRKKVLGQSRKAFWNPGFVPAFPGLMRSVVTVHDLIHLHYYSKAHIAYYNYVFKPLYRKCDAILCVSEFTRNEFLEWSGVDGDKVFVIPNGIEPNFSQLGGAVSTDRPYVFYAGNRRNYKNVPLLVKAFFSAGLHRAGYDILLTGTPDPGLMDLALAAGGDQNLKFLGFLADDQLVSYYKGSSLVAFLSDYEGFGLPVLEAMACSVPLLLANRTSLPEVAGQGAFYVDPQDFDSVVEGIKSACLDSHVRAAIVEHYPARLAMYSIDESAARLWDIVLGVAKN